ncbi:MAG: hypothetical protein DRN07_03070, partial [Thermoplasmata archaeon]
TEVTDVKHIPKEDIPALLVELEAEMRREADALNFERAIQLREQIKRLENLIINPSR